MSRRNVVPVVRLIAYVLLAPILCHGEVVNSNPQQDLANLCEKGSISRDQFAVLYTFGGPITQKQINRGVPYIWIGIFARKSNTMYRENFSIYLDPISKAREISHDIQVFNGDTSRAWYSRTNSGGITPEAAPFCFLEPTCYSRYIYFVHDRRLPDFISKSGNLNITVNEDRSVTIESNKQNGADQFSGTTVTLEPKWNYLIRSLSGFIHGRFTGGFEVKEFLTLGNGDRKRFLPKRIVITPSKRTGSSNPITLEVTQVVDLYDLDPSVLHLQFPEGCLVVDQMTGKTEPVGDKHIESIPIESHPTLSSSLFHIPISEVYARLKDLADSTPIQ